MVPFTVFIVDDEESIRQGVTFGLKRDCDIKAFPAAEEAIEALKVEPPDLVLLDIGLPRMNGVEALKEIKKLNYEILVIMVTAYEDIDTVIAAMKLGAYDYIVKPIHMDSLRITVSNALETIGMRKEIRVLQEKYLSENLPCLIGESSAIQDLMGIVDKVAKSPDTPVLILGESGTGKELICRAIHCKSPNFCGPFVTLNCAAIPRELIESELFGYEKGAFSGASTAGKKGLIEQAAEGTLFLDEVGDLSLEAQAKLLRFLEDGEYYRVGGTRKLYVHTRIVSATNKNLDQMIAKERFREDLYYRLAVIRVEVPSLNDRREDILPIARYFLLELSKKYGKPFHSISPQVEEFLKTHHWKGNIRELRNLIERGVILGNGPELKSADIGLKDAPGSVSAEHGAARTDFPPLTDQGIDLKALEEYYIREALRMAGGNDRKAARLLKLNYYSLRYRKKKLTGRAGQ